MDIKISGYNFVFPFCDSSGNQQQRVLYNSRTGSLALIEEEQFQIYEKFANGSEVVFEQELLDNLKMGGFVIDSSIDELDLIRLNLLQSRFDRSVLSLTIAPTSNCNFRCVYCYEKDSIQPVTMSEETQDSLMNFVDNNLHGVTGFNVSWYGGEPLLALGIIEKLSRYFISTCKERNIVYNASIVTNGYLLSNQVVDRLVAMKISNIQVTLDGAAEDHDLRRPLVGGLPTFNRIVDNLGSLKGRTDILIAIRINTDKHNIDRVDRVVDILNERGLTDITRPYLAMVENLNGTYNDNGCFHTNEFSMVMYNFILRNKLNAIEYIPVQISNYCCADFAGAYVVNADGRLYKCWCDIGNLEKAVGSVNEGIVNNDVLCSYMLYNAADDQECKACKYLPICMGGCPFLRIMRSTQRCSKMKHGLSAFMEVIPTLLLNQKA